MTTTFHQSNAKPDEAAISAAITLAARRWPYHRAPGHCSGGCARAPTTSLAIQGGDDLIARAESNT